MYIYSPEAAPDSGVFGSVVSSRSKLRLHTLIRTPRTSYKLTFAHPPLSRVNPTHLSLRVYIYICIHRYSYIGIYIYIYIYIYIRRRRRRIQVCWVLLSADDTTRIVTG